MSRLLAVDRTIPGEQLRRSRASRSDSRRHSRSRPPARVARARAHSPRPGPGCTAQSAASSSAESRPTRFRPRAAHRVVRAHRSRAIIPFAAAQWRAVILSMSIDTGFTPRSRRNSATSGRANLQAHASASSMWTRGSGGTVRPPRRDQGHARLECFRIDHHVAHQVQPPQRGGVTMASTRAPRRASVSAGSM